MRKRADWKQAVLEAGRARVEKRWQLKIVAAAGKSELCTEAGLGQCRCQNLSDRVSTGSRSGGGERHVGLRTPSGCPS